MILIFFNYKTLPQVGAYNMCSACYTFY